MVITCFFVPIDGNKIDCFYCVSRVKYNDNKYQYPYPRNTIINA